MSSDERIRIYRSCNTFLSRHRRRDFPGYPSARNASGAKTGGCDGADFDVNGRRRHRLVARMVFFVILLRASSIRADESADKYKSAFAGAMSSPDRMCRGASRGGKLSLTGLISHFFFSSEAQARLPEGLNGKPKAYRVAYQNEH